MSAYLLMFDSQKREDVGLLRRIPNCDPTDPSQLPTIGPFSAYSDGERKVWKCTLSVNIVDQKCTSWLSIANFVTFEPLQMEFWSLFLAPTLINVAP